MCDTDFTPGSVHVKLFRNIEVYWCLFGDTEDEDQRSTGTVWKRQSYINQTASKDLFLIILNVSFCKINVYYTLVHIFDTFAPWLKVKANEWYVALQYILIYLKFSMSVWSHVCSFDYITYTCSCNWMWVTVFTQVPHFHFHQTTLSWDAAPLCNSCLVLHFLVLAVCPLRLPVQIMGWSHQAERVLWCLSSNTEECA